MNKKKLLPIIVLLAVVIAAVSATIICLNTCNGNSDPHSKTEHVTVTFDVNGGSKVEPITLDKGEKLESIPQTYLTGNSFDGWYTDKALTKEFSVDTKIDKDLTLYAGYSEIIVDVNVTKPTTQYIEDATPDHSVTIITSKSYSKEEFLKTIKIEAVTGILPWEYPTEIDDSLPKAIGGWLDVTISGFEYTVSPKEIEFNGKGVYAYSDGKLYKITIPSSMRFKGLEDSVVEYNFRVKAEKKDSVTDNVTFSDNKIHFVAREDVLNIKDIAKTEQEESITKVESFSSTISYIKDENGYYNLLFSNKVYDKYKFEKDNIICIGNGEELDVDSIFVKVTDVKARSFDSEDKPTEYLILAIDAEIEEVFNEIDVNYNKPITAEEIINGLDTESMTETLKTNGSVDKVTNLMTNLLLISDEVQAVYAEGRKATQYRGGIDPDTGLPEFCNNTSISNEATLLKVNLLKGAEVSISVGTGHNPNFDPGYTDEFVALKITFSYEAVIKNRLEIKAEIVFTQFLAASAQGYLEYELGFFSLEYAEFDAAVNLYSQTNFDFKILVRTVKPDGVDSNNGNNNNKKDDDNKFEDIAEKISEKLKNEEGDDPNNLVAELKSMLESESGYLELFRAPILRIPIDIIPGLPVMRVTVELDFLIEMNFAAGFSAHMSVLEAVQVGIKGDTRTKTVSSYKYDNLPGSNQYAVQLSACGYLGFRAGFKGGLSLSFCGLSSLGKVGVYVYVGPYVDIYGFAQATFAKYGGTVSQSLVGGYYVEIGVFLDVTLEARSDKFGVKVGTSLFNKKWPLITFGNKDVLISIATNDLEETIYLENTGEETASAKVDILPKLQGTYLDITTGETKVKDIPWDKVGLRMSSPSFYYDKATETIHYRNLYSTKPITETCIATYNYKGSILQFNTTAAKAKELYPFASVKVVYYDSTKIDKDFAGKEVSVKIYSEVDGKKELLEEKKVITGTIIHDYAKLDPYKYANISWNKLPYKTPITEDTEFVCSGELRQVYIAFIWYDVDKDVWLTDVRACNLGEVPIAPEVQSKGKVTHVGWYGDDGINCNVKHTPSECTEPGKTVTVDDMWVYGYFIDSTYGKDVTKGLVNFDVPEKNNDADLYGQLFDSKYKSDMGFAWYYSVASIYVAKYEYEDCKLTVHHCVEEAVPDNEYTIAFRGKLTSYATYNPLKYNLVGYALEENGEVVYNTLFDLDALKKDVVLYAKYETVSHEVKLYRYNAETNEYSLYKTASLFGGQRISDLDEEDLAAIKTVEAADGVECQYLWLNEKIGDELVWLSENEICASPTSIYPIFSRKVKITFDSGDGIIPYGENQTKKQVFDYAESLYSYKVVLDFTTCLKYLSGEEAAKYNCKHVGWKNESTGEVLLLKDSKVTYCDKATTFTAVYENILRTDYSVSIKTTHSTLQDGSKEIVRDNLTYEEFLEYKNAYDNWTPDDYRDDENHCTYKQIGILDFSKENRYEIEYKFNRVIDTHKVELNLNGGENDNSSTLVYNGKEWGSEIDLSLVRSTRDDDYGTWKPINWSDTRGNTYSLGAKYKVLGDDVLTLNWQIDTYKDYTITFFLDDVSIGKKTYHKDDSLESIGKPKEADGKVFSGWKWVDPYNDYEEIEPQDKMPAKNLYLYGTTSTVYIYYLVDGIEIAKEEGKVAYEESVKETYVKEGYTVTPWETSDVSVTDGKFTMPEKDVKFTATASVNSYKVTYYHKDKVYSEQSFDFGTRVTLPKLPAEEGAEYVWFSEDVKLFDTGFYMPAKDVTIKTVSAENTVYVIYYVNDEIVSYAKTASGQLTSAIDYSLYAKEGKTFSGWYSPNVTIQEDYSFTVGKETVYVYGYFTSGAKKLNVYFNESNLTPDLVLYASIGDTVNLSVKIADKDISGYKINGAVVSEITVSDIAETNVYVQYANKKYRIDYSGYGVALPDSAYYAAGEKVVLPALPEVDSEYSKAEGWFLAEAEIKTDENNKAYFIMPAQDVVINLIINHKPTPKEGYKIARVYLNLPFASEIFYRDFYVDSDNVDTPLHFSDYTPSIEGYEFICWKDSKGNTISENFGIKYDDMTEDLADKNEDNVWIYKGEYRKLELHMIEFSIDNKVVAYREFYDSSLVEIDAPTVELAEGEAFSGWKNFYLNIFLSPDSGKLRFYTGDYQTHEYSKTDFVFDGYIYREENALPVHVIYQENDTEEGAGEEYEISANENSQLKFSKYLNGKEVECKLSARYFILETLESQDLVLENAVIEQGDTYIVTIPSVAELKTKLNLGEDDTIDYFIIELSPKTIGN